MSRSFLCSVSSVRMIADCLFCRCRGLFLCSESSVRMIDECVLCRCRGLSCVQGVLLG